MKSKPVLLFIGTLIIGFVLGVLVSAQIRFHRLNPVRVFFSEERFREGFYRAIQPDQQQKAKIDLVLDKYAKINSELQNNFRREFDASMKDFRKEIDSFLTRDQIARLKDMDERRKQMIHHGHMMHENDTSEPRNERRHHYNREPSPENDMHLPSPYNADSTGSSGDK
jgi:hypothetical protein